MPVALLGVDAEGYVIFGLGQFATDEPSAAIAIEEQIREALRLPARADAAAPGARQPAARPELPGAASSTRRRASTSPPSAGSR